MAGLGVCDLAYGDNDEGRCVWCGRPLPPRRRRWCRTACSTAYARNHWWKQARAACLLRDRYRCRRCRVARAVEVNHVVPLQGRPRTRSCEHHLDNLEALCHACHVTETATQRAAGALIPRGDAPIG